MNLSDRAAQVGRWKMELFPWLRDVMDAAADPLTRMIVIDGPPQTGKTHASLVIGEWAAEQGRSVLCVVATDRAACDLRRQWQSNIPVIGAHGALPKMSTPTTVHLFLGYEQFPPCVEGHLPLIALKRALSRPDSLVVVEGWQLPLQFHLMSDRRSWCGDRWERHRSSEIAGFTLPWPRWHR